MSPQQYLFTVYIAVGLCFNHLRKHRSNWLSFAFTICPLCTCLSILCLVNKACTVTVCVFVYVRSWVWVISLCCARNPIAALNDNLMRGKKRKRYLQIWAEGWWKPLPTRLDAPVSCPSLVLLGLSLSLSFFPSLHPATSCGNTIAQHLCPLTDTTSHASLIIHEACCDWLCAGGARTGFQVGSVFFFFSLPSFLFCSLFQIQLYYWFYSTSSSCLTERWVFFHGKRLLLTILLFCCSSYKSADDEISFRYLFNLTFKTVDGPLLNWFKKNCTRYVFFFK